MAAACARAGWGSAVYVVLPLRAAESRSQAGAAAGRKGSGQHGHSPGSPRPAHASACCGCLQPPRKRGPALLATRPMNARRSLLVQRAEQSAGGRRGGGSAGRHFPPLPPPWACGSEPSAGPRVTCAASAGPLRLPSPVSLRRGDAEPAQCLGLM